ncbi:hypothetical protein HC928_24355 [bacterium]|nr:hypothetical protein [bacterium]
MVRHITAGIRLAHFETVHHHEKEFGLLPKPAKPPTRPLRQNVLEPM